MKTNRTPSNNSITLFAIIFITLFFPSISFSQCAGANASITICDKEVYDQGLANPIGTVDLFVLLGGAPVAGGTWNDDDSSGGLNTTTGLLTTWAINQGGVFNYTYTANPPCAISTATITVTLGGFPGTDNPFAVACDTDTSINLFSFLGFGPSATFGGTWSDDDGTGALSGQFLDASSLPATLPFDFTYTIPAVGVCPPRSATVTITAFPSPDAGTPTDLTLCETDDFTPYTAFDLLTQLFGQDPGGNWADLNLPLTGEISGPLDSVINIQNINTTFGPGTYSFQYTVNPINPICAPQSSIVNIIIEPIIDISGATLTIAPDPLCFIDVATTPIIATISEGVILIPDGTYDITYATTPVPNNGSETVSVVFTGGIGTWTINPAFLTTSGIVTVDVTNILDPTTITNCERVITTLNATFELINDPDPSDTQVVVDDVCFGDDAIGTVSDAGGIGGIQLVDDTYTITYTITPTGSSFTASVVIVGGTGVFTIPAAQIPTEDTTYTIEITNWENAAGCATASSIIDTFYVSPLPDATNISITIPDVCDGDDVIVTITDTSSPLVLVDGVYDIMYDITGPPDLLGQTEFGVVITGGTGSFTIPGGTLPFATYTFTITNLLNSATTCDTTTFSTPNTNFEIHEIPSAADVLLNVADICLGSDGVVNISDANFAVFPDLPDGLYDITYDLSGANISAGNLISALITATNGSFNIPSALLTNTGTTTVTVTIITNVTTGCDAVGVPIVTSFEVNPIPDIDNVAISVSQPICEGDDGTVSIIGTTLPDGDYDLIYDLTGDNVFTGNTVTATFTGGSTTFTLPTIQIPNTGSTTITITNITAISVITMCANTVTNVSTTFTVSPNPVIDASNLEIPEQDICLGQSKDIDVLGTTLTDGSYTITYDVSDPASVGNMATLVITGGDGSFTIPAGLLTNVANIVITITNIVNDATGCSSILNIQTNFNIIPLPDAAGATVDAFGPYCQGDPVTAQMLTALGLPDGGYNVSYDLSGANTAIGINTVLTFSAGSSNIFVIPAPLNNGTTTLTITVISSVATGCTVSGLTISDTFIINPTPDLTLAEITVVDICLGSDGLVTIVSTGGLIDGIYTFTYNLSGANTVALQPVSFIMATGTGSFTIPSALLINTGITTIEITNIVNDDNTCSNAFTTLNINFEVNQVPIIVAATHLEIPEQNICLGNDKDIDVLGTTLVDGTYTITYNISSPPSVGNTSTLTIDSGDGVFTIPSVLLTNLGNVVITITEIENDTTNCGTNGLSEQTNFNIVSINGAVLGISNICFNDSDAIATILNAAGLLDGDYTIMYDLSGANTATDETTITTFTSGDTSFSIPVGLLGNPGTTILTVTNIISPLLDCETNSLTPQSFEIINPTPPSLNDATITYCINDVPTIETLISNISNPFGYTLTWYDSATGGSILTDTSLELIHDQIYYVTFSDLSFCESVRFPITVNLTGCDNLIIPNAFSPNGDGQNDTYTIQFIDLIYPNYTIEIYNRYGNIVHKGNINTPDFNGKSNQNSFLSNDILPVGIYFYIIDFNDNVRKPIQGDLYLSR
ncbi:MAG: gliding motility-associated C-terminal domain-containing protein [Flavobacteriaceae bacterium]|nr:gliding motility-associated C-terminal domain-containing protein [Flavobacteriaceae bacterium]